MKGRTYALAIWTMRTVLLVIGWVHAEATKAVCLQNLASLISFFFVSHCQVRFESTDNDIMTTAMLGTFAVMNNVKKWIRIREFGNVRMKTTHFEWFLSGKAAPLFIVKPSQPNRPHQFYTPSLVMTTRSRTGLFRSYRDSQARSTRQQPYRRPAYDDTDFTSDEHDHLISNSNHVTVNIPHLPPLWFTLAFLTRVTRLILLQQGRHFWSSGRHPCRYTSQELVLLLPTPISFYFIPVIIVHTLDKLHAKHVLPGFSDRSQEERDIEAFTTDITKVWTSCSQFEFQILISVTRPSVLATPSFRK